MSKRVWIWIVFIALFPPLVMVPLIQYLFYFPIRDGVIGGSRIRFYFWGLSITALSAIAAIPMSLDKKLDFIKIYKYLGTPSNATTYIILSFLIGILSIFLFYYSTRNEPEQKQFLPVRKFNPDKLFYICLALSFFPYVAFLSITNLSLDDIVHPSAYAISVAFISKSYLSVILGFFSITVLTAIVEESFFRGITLRDYFNVDKKRQYLLLFLAALYFAYCHLPISFIFPFIFALFINRVRLAYNNLVPGMILHAIWNANVIIITLILLNPNAPVHVQRTATEEIKAISEVWKQKDLEVAKKSFPKYKIEKGFYVFEGIHSKLIISTYKGPQIILLTAVIKKQSLDVEKILYSKDWENKKGEHKTLRCSKLKDLCVESDANFFELKFGYDKYANEN